MDVRQGMMTACATARSALLVGLSAALLVACAADGGGDEAGEPDARGADTTAVADVALPGADVGGAADTGGGHKPDGGTPPSCLEGASCDDGDPCTHTDVCSGGVCAGEPYDCDDGLGCTADVCLGDGTCDNPLKGGHCLIDGACQADGDANPDNGCEACLPPLSATEWSPGPAVACDDGDACTDGDTCSGGACIGAPVICESDVQCQTASCDPAVGCVAAPLDGVDCDDGDPCTEGDTCSEGECLPGLQTMDCDDGDPCTDDLCTPDGCQYAPNTAPCDDGDPCTVGDVCVEGVCQAGPAADCDDGNPCTDDACVPGEGCAHVNNAEPCDDGDPCGLGDRCVAGVCRAGAARPNCDDGNPCTDDICEVGVGCQNVANANPCDDGDLCTTTGSCSGGVCRPGMPVDCADDDPCTDDLCESDRGCYQAPGTGAACDDADPCTVGDTCGDGVCLAGVAPLDCDDGNDCTVDRCDAGVGCQHDPLDAVACDDADPCTVGDTCDQGLCVSGADPLDCDDDNVCTADRCDTGVGCQHDPLDALACDDADACTVDDACAAGVCVGAARDCSDGNDCTVDLCDSETGCYQEADSALACWPQIDFSPARGATLTGNGAVTVSGTVSGPAAPITSLTINGAAVDFDPTTGEFLFPMNAPYGLTVLRVDIEDALGGRREVRQSFQMSDRYYDFSTGVVADARVTDGLLFYASEEVVDDGDRSDVDDLATIFEMMFASIDIGTMIDNPLASESVGWCTYRISIHNIRHGAPQVGVDPRAGALAVSIVIPNFSADVEADASGFGCPDTDVDVSATRIEIDAVVGVSYANGQIQTNVISTNVEFVGLDYSVGGDFGWLADIILDAFSGTIESTIESEFESQIADLVPDILTDALTQLALEQAFEIPSFLGDGEPTPLLLTSDISGLEVRDDGLVIRLATSVTAPKAIAYEPAGTIARGGCLLGPPTPPVLRRTHSLELGLHDDVLNEVLFALYWGGGLEMTLDEEAVGMDLSGRGITDLVLGVSFMLPPIVVGCDDAGPLLIQIGDIRIDATLNLFGQPLEVTMFASAIAEGGVELAETPDGAELGLRVDEIRSLDVEITDINEGQEDMVPALRQLIEEQLLPRMVDGLASGALGSFPIPAIDLSGFDESIPAGTEIAIQPEELWRMDGYTAAGGGVRAAQ